jgi:hypothetical protein
MLSVFIIKKQNLAGGTTGLFPFAAIGASALTIFGYLSP